MQEVRGSSPRISTIIFGLVSAKLKIILTLREVPLPTPMRQLFLSVNSCRIASVAGSLAQLVEQRPEEPCVPSSSLGGATKIYRAGLAQLFRAHPCQG